MLDLAAVQDALLFMLEPLRPKRKQMRFQQLLENAEGYRWPMTVERNRRLRSVDNRISLLREIWEEFRSLCLTQGDLEAEALLPTLWLYWIPFAVDLSSDWSVRGRTVVQGVVGPPGSGKSTFSAVLLLILEGIGHHSVALSLDDLYLPTDMLSRGDACPHLSWRGPPGTHDIRLGVRFFEQLALGEPIVWIPRFDKSARDGAGERAQMERTRRPDLVLFEGWIVGLRRRPPSEIRRTIRHCRQADLELALAVNERLLEYYALWQWLDRLLLLHVPETAWIREMRLQAERARREAGIDAMSEAVAAQFVEYLLTAVPPQVHYLPLLRGSAPVGQVVVLGRNREWSLYRSARDGSTTT